jgi:F0F1-type ATP synthase assembly protein I
MADPTTGRPDGSDYRGLAVASTAVAEIVAPVLIGLWLDSRFGSSPWGATVGAVLGVMASVTHLVLIGRKS